MKIILCDSAVFEVEDPLEGPVGEQVNLLQVWAPQWNGAELFPNPWSQMQIQRFPGADSHCHEDAQEAKLDHVILWEGRWIQQEPFIEQSQRQKVKVTLRK